MGTAGVVIWTVFAFGLAALAFWIALDTWANRG